MEIHTLETVSLDELTHTFNASFADYFVKIEMTPSALHSKIKQEQIDLSLSVGVFDKGQLVGFILNGIGTMDGLKAAYNGGTGILPEYRGNRSTQKMYQFIIPMLKSKGIKICRLEVIDANKRAIHVYETIGFRTQRSFDCLKGIVNPNYTLKRFEIKELGSPPWEQLPSFWDVLPSWSYSIEANQQIQDDLCMVGAFDGAKLIGYAFALPDTGRITQFGVHLKYRRKKIGKSLFAKLGQLGNPKMTIINVDKRGKGVLAFLQKIGFSSYIGQFEMTMTI